MKAVFLHFFYLPLFCFISSIYSTSGTKNVQVKIIPEYIQINEVKNFRLGVLFKINPGWHIYWKNPGDSGIPTKTKWSLPHWLVLKNTILPTPIKTLLGSIVSYGYEKSAFIVSTFEPKLLKDAPPLTPIKIMAEVRWLECKEICLPGKSSLTISLPQAQIKSNPIFKEHFQKNKSTYPQRSATIQAKAFYEGENIELVVSGLTISKSEKLNNLYFFIDKPDIIQHSNKQKYQFDAEGVLTLYLPANASHTQKEDTIAGYLNIYQENDRAALEGGGQSNLPLVYSIHASVQGDYTIYIAFLIIIVATSLWYFYHLTKHTAEKS